MTNNYVEASSSHSQEKHESQTVATIRSAEPFSECLKVLQCASGLSGNLNTAALPSPRWELLHQNDSLISD